MAPSTIGSHSSNARYSTTPDAAVTLRTPKPTRTALIDTSTNPSPPGMNTAEELAAVFGFDVTQESFWTASLDILRDHIDQYVDLASKV